MLLKLKYYKTLFSLFKLCIFWIIFDGVFRKWVFPEISSLIFGIKYLLFSTLFAFYMLYTKKPIKKITYGYPFYITLFLIWCTFVFLLNNPLNSSLLVRIMGVVNYLFFLPLIAIVPLYFNSISTFEKSIKFLAYISIPIYILGMIQYYLPTDHFLNYLVNEEQKITKVAGYTRTLSIFTFVKIYNVYLLQTILIFSGFILYLYQKGKSYTIYTLLVGMAILNTVMTASRLPVFLSIFFISIILIYGYTAIPSLRKFILTSVILTLITGIVLYSTSVSVKNAVDAFLFRVEVQEIVAEKGASFSTEERIINRIHIFKHYEKAGLLGFGIGTTYQGTGGVLSMQREDIEYEDEGERVILEIGVIGGVLILLMRLSIFFFCLSFVVKIKHQQYMFIALPLLLYITPQTFFLSNVTFNYLDGFSYWISFSLLLALKNIYSNFLREEELKYQLK